MKKIFKIGGIVLAVIVLGIGALLGVFSGTKINGSYVRQ